MYHLVVYRKTDGAIQRVLTTNTRHDSSLVGLGFNPVLYEVLRVVARDRIEPSKWRVENGLLVPLITKEEELMLNFKSGKRKDGTFNNEEGAGLHIVFVGDATNTKTGFGTQYKFLKEGLVRRGYRISEMRYQNIPQLVDVSCDFVLALSDYGSVKTMFDLGLDNLVYWFALESPDWPNRWNSDLLKVPFMVPLTKYGKKALEENSIECEEVVPHGIDVAAFRPLPIQQRALLRRENKVDNRFVVSYLGTNVRRKRLDLLIKAFALFVRDADVERKALLILKTKVNGHYDVQRLIEQYSAEYELKDFASQVRIVEREMDTTEIGQLINISDLGFNATSGEGFCVPTIEYMMSGVPFLAGRHTSFPELIGAHLPLISVDDIWIDDRFEWTRYNIDPIHASEIIGEYFINWKNDRSYDRNKLREIALPYATERMVTAWDRLFKQLERKKVEAEFMQKASAGLLGVAHDTAQQQIYERASRAIDTLGAQSQQEVPWIKVY